MVKPFNHTEHSATRRFRFRTISIFVAPRRATHTACAKFTYMIMHQ